MRQFATELVRIYDRSLEQQIVQHGSSLACRDVELWTEVESMLRDGDAKEKHCLGLDPLLVMEESLNAASSSAQVAVCGRSLKTRSELRGLAKAFEVLEQAALNLYLGPWRKEYRVIKMYSGTFTHCITPVLSMAQIEKLFGLLGYQSGSPEQLCLQSGKVSPAVMADLLRLSCAFFIARCECRLLSIALGKHVGDAQWELNVVRERLKGNSLQVALDNTKKTLEISQSAALPADEDLELYADERVNEGQKAMDVSDEDHPHFEKMVQSNPPSSPVQSRSVTAVYASLPNKSKSTKSLSEKTTSQQKRASGFVRGEGDLSCQCLHSSRCLKECLQCKAVHDLSCSYLSVCETAGHHVAFRGPLTENREGLGKVPEPSESGPNSSPSDGASAASPHPIGFHDCCDLSKPNPQFLCQSCRVFHVGSCKGLKACQTQHDVSPLGVCGCGKPCSRSPLVLCRYCGTEYCRNCWYKNPITCECGETFDQSSSV